MAKSTYGVSTTEFHFYFLGEDTVYSSLATELGLIKDYSGPLESIQFDGRKYNGLRQRVTVAGRRTTATPAGTKSFNGQVWCATEKLEEAIKGLVGQNYGGVGSIKKAYIRSGGRSVS